MQHKTTKYEKEAHSILQEKNDPKRRLGVRTKIQSGLFSCGSMERQYKRARDACDASDGNDKISCKATNILLKQARHENCNWSSNI